MKKTIFSLFVFELIFCFSLYAQPNPVRRKEKESLKIDAFKTLPRQKEEDAKTIVTGIDDYLSIALSSYIANNLQGVQTALNSFFAKTPRTDTLKYQYANLIQAKIMTSSGSYNEANMILEDLELNCKHPKLRYEIMLDRAILNIHLKRIEKSVDKFIDLLEKKLTNTDYDMIERAAEMYLSIISYLYANPLWIKKTERITNPNTTAIILMAIGNRISSLSPHLASPLFELTNKTLSNIQLKETYQPDLKTLQRKLAQVVSNRKVPILKIGVLSQISFEPYKNGIEQSVGNQMIESAIDASNAYNDTTQSQFVELYITSTKGLNEKQLLAATKSLTDTMNVHLLYGPIYSNEVLMVGKFCKPKNIIIITPTATDETIGKLYPNCYQINPPFYYRGKAVAKFITDTFESFAIPLSLAVIAEDSTNGKRMAEGFVDKIKETKNEVKWNATLSPRFKSMDKAIQIFNPNLKFDELMGYDSTFFDAIYIPIQDYEKAVIVLSQLKLFCMTGLILGMGDWAYTDILKKYKPLMNGMIYSTDTYVNAVNPFISEKTMQYQHKRKQAPTNYYWVGYGSISYLFNTIQSSSLKTKLDVGIMLKNAKPYKAIHTTIYFKNSNVNQNLNFLEYKDDEIRQF